MGTRGQGTKGQRDKKGSQRRKRWDGGQDSDSTRPCGRSGVGAAADGAGRLDFTWMIAK